MRKKHVITIAIIVVCGLAPSLKVMAGFCAGLTPCPDPSVLGGLTGCVQRTGCVATPSSEPIRTDGPCSYNREFTNSQTATDFTVIDGENCYRQYTVYEVYDLFRWWKVYQCTYADGNGPTAAQCTFCIDKSSTVFRGENVDGIDSRPMGICTDYISFSNAQWHCNGVLT
jgi:hypothetical protein